MGTSSKRSAKELVKVVFEDTHLIVLNKSANVHSANLPGARSKDLTVADFLAHYFASAPAASLKPEDAGLVNRLDFETSGLIIAAKSRKVWLALREMFKAGRVSKFYLALLEGCPKHLGLQSCFLGSSSHSSKKVRAFSKKPGSRYRAVKVQAQFKLVHADAQGQYSVVEVDLRTGARHQIRAQAAFLGAPLVGDSLYGAKSSIHDILADSSEGRSFVLHSHKLSLAHPITGKRLFFVAPPPRILKRLLALD